MGKYRNRVHEFINWLLWSFYFSSDNVQIRLIYIFTRFCSYIHFSLKKFQKVRHYYESLNIYNSESHPLLITTTFNKLAKMIQSELGNKRQMTKCNFLISIIRHCALYLIIKFYYLISKMKLVTKFGMTSWGQLWAHFQTLDSKYVNWFYIHSGKFTFGGCGTFTQWYAFT